MDNKDYELKQEGELVDFGNGAVRYMKNKGRFDLIPMETLKVYLKYVNGENVETNIDVSDFLKALTCEDEFRYVRIIDMVLLRQYGSNRDESFPKMFLDLAIHFQKGGQRHGDHNCEGLPLWTFVDSGTRHLMQFLSGKTDEPHYIAAIWNFWMAAWFIVTHEQQE